MSQLAHAGQISSRPGDDVRDIHEGRRHDLAVAALHTWSEYGYSHVSVRNVARRTRFSHGMVHYYFRSKDALVAECVRIIQESHIFGADVSGAADVPSISRIVVEAICESLRTNRRLHRIRFDLRNQSQFERELRGYATEVEEAHDVAVQSIRRRYETLGWRFEPSFELLAIQIDALRERAVRADLLGDDLTAAVAQLRTGLVQVLPG